MRKVSHSTAIVVDDHPLFRRGVVELLNESSDFEVIKDYGSAIDLIASMPFDTPDLLLLDLQMPDMTGLEALKELKPLLPETKIVILTFSTDSQSLIDAISIGADGYLLKDTDGDQILKHLKSVIDGKMAMDESSTTILAQTIRDQNKITIPSPKQELLIDMTEREKQTLQLISKGMSNKLIASQLGISDGTVKVYVKSLLRKLGLHSRLELAAWNHQHKVFNIDDSL